MMYKYALYTVITVAYALIMLAIFIASVHRINHMEDETDNALTPYVPMDSGKLMLIVWGCYVIQMALLMLYDLGEG